MAAKENYGIHLLAGGIGGTVGAVLTCPLEVVKTRLQSSVASFHQPVYLPSHRAVHYVPGGPSLNWNINCSEHNLHEYHHTTRTGTLATRSAISVARRQSVGLYYSLRHIIEVEGVNGLFKGLGPNLVGVAPSRAIYFFCYAGTKQRLNQTWTPDTPLVHMTSAVTAGITASTLTNPIWFIKTRLQLDMKKDNHLTCRQCIRNIYQNHGLKGFYKGISASYFGVTETVIHFVIYEAVKAQLLANRSDNNGQSVDRQASDFFRYMLAGAISKTTATCIAYPHEVARTRLREEGTKYKSFFQTLFLVAKEDGYRGLYRGLGTQLVRQIPNTAIMMATYELVVYLHSGTVGET
ncbi:hypothetical protein ACJMK2_007495 [Sinanodonta woodiana]|uniref:Solute carrier family 25 member 36 n=1 Tax=Sinanodonta woodiana TaxID=1069815 RepID=A0ABD3VJY7_SINWO